MSLVVTFKVFYLFNVYISSMHYQSIFFGPSPVKLQLERDKLMQTDILALREMQKNGCGLGPHFNFSVSYAFLHVAY